jgi:hypothetical protein
MENRSRKAYTELVLCLQDLYHITTTKPESYHKTIRNIWNLRSEIFSSVYMPMIYTNNNSNSFLNIERSYRSSATDYSQYFNDYNLLIQSDAIYSDLLVENKHIFKHSDLEFDTYRSESVISNFYSNSLFKIWFTHVFLCGEPSSSFNIMDNIRYNYYSELLQVLFNMQRYSLYIEM